MDQINIQFKIDENKYITLYKEIKKMIMKGVISPNEKLPSKRNLALHLSISNNTVINAYNLLLDEGYIYSKEKSGYYVSPNRYLFLDKQVNEFQEEKKKTYKYDFTSENIDESLFPFYTFKKVTERIISENKDIWLTRNNYQGDKRLRKNLAKYLYENKGMEVDENNIVIVSSLEESLQIISSLIKVDRVALENPIFPKVNSFFSNREITYLDVDKEGVIIDKNLSFDIIYTTPYNQYPSGVKMTPKRRLEVINSNVSYIFEDDFDCDIIQQNKVISTLYSLNPNKVIYHGSFSHTLCPGLRISYLVLPHSLVKTYKDKYKDSSSRISSLDQSILSSFLEEGHYYRHINKLRKSLKIKSEIIQDIFIKKNIKYEKNELSFFIHSTKSKEDLSSSFEKHNIKINLMSKYMKNKEDDRIIICYTNLKVEDINDSINLLLSII